VRAFVCMLCVFTVLAGRTDEEPSRRAWHVSVGPALIGGVRPKLGLDTGRMVQASGFATAQTASRLSTAPLGPTREAAYAAGAGVDEDGQPVRRVFDGGAWYDPVDAATAAGYDNGYSWNFRLHDPAGLDPDGRKGFVETTAYVVERETIVSETVAPGRVDDDAECMPGVRLEVARDLYVSDDERPWGVECAVGFACYFARDVWKDAGTAATAAVEGSRDYRHFEWWNDSHDEAQYILDYYRETQFQGGMWGVGSSLGPGMELASDAWKVRDVRDRLETWSGAHALRYHAHGDYEAYALDFLVRPWWEPCDWLRVFGSVGLEVAYREFSWSLSVAGTDGSHASERGRERDVGVCGLLGGGVAVTWHDFFLTGEVLWRCGGNDLKVDGAAVHGDIETGDWGIRIALGYSF